MPLSLRFWAAAYLLVQAVAAVAWWGLLFAWPASRKHFLVAGAPEVTLFAFVIADGLLFVGGAVIAAVGMLQERRWATIALAVHTGAAGYAALYCWTLTALAGGDAILGALLMTPSLLIPATLLGLLSRSARLRLPAHGEGRDEPGSPE